MSGQLVIEQSLLDRMPVSGEPLQAVPRRRAARWHRTAWRGLDPSAVVDCLATAPATVVVLVRSHTADPGAACLEQLARLLGHRVLRLPDDPDEAAWSASAAARIVPNGRTSDRRAVEVICAGPHLPCPAPRRPWGPASLRAPWITPESLARWAACLWRSCRWCGRGGAPGFACPTCGVAVPREAGPS